MNISDKPFVKILLVEDNLGDARLMREMLTGARGNYPSEFLVISMDRLSAAIEHLRNETYEAILLDLSLPDSQGLETLDRMIRSAPQTPVVVLTGLDDEQIAVRAVQSGAQDYLVKGRIDGDLLVRAIRYAVERKRAEEKIYLMLSEKERLVKELSYANTELEKSQAILRDLAIRDELTRLYNRREMDLILQEEMQRSRRYNRPLSLVMLDIDHFKNVNDEYGHPGGDQILRSFGFLLKENLRATDRPIRYGGEEFGIILPEQDGDEAWKTAERLRQVIAGHSFALDKSIEERLTIHLTVSLGVGVFPIDADSKESLITHADQALYEAKRKGRNCAVLFSQIEDGKKRL
jgi:diguanylate cyclase (GGDEF)-like protein